MKNNKKIFLYGKYAIPIIIFLKLFNKISFAINMLFIYMEIRLLFEITDIGYYFFSLTGGFVIIVLLCLLPLIAHILYISLTKFGYVFFLNDYAEIHTKTFTHSFSYYNSLTIESKKRCPFRNASNYTYYSVKMIFEENGEIYKIHLYTDNLNYFDSLTERFCKAN